jgi:hypothetical protein
MSDLVSESGYTDSETQTFIKVRITATNDYGKGSASEENVDSAVYQGEPLPYTGAITVV